MDLETELGRMVRQHGLLEVVRALKAYVWYRAATEKTMVFAWDKASDILRKTQNDIAKLEPLK